MRTYTPEEVRSQNRAAVYTDTYMDYDRTMEEYCMEVRAARGWTTTDPRESRDSTVPRWAQDAKDYGLFRDRVLLYGLDVLNRYRADGVPPCSLQEFTDRLHAIKCTWTYTDEADTASVSQQ